MEAQEPDHVVQVDEQETWTDAVRASLGPRDGHIADEEIFEILNAGYDRETAAEVFAAKGITLPMFCVWKAKYRRMSLEDLREARRRELWRARALAGALVIALVMGAGGVVFGLARAVQANITGGAASATVPSTSESASDLGARRPAAARPSSAPARMGPVDTPAAPPAESSGTPAPAASEPALPSARPGSATTRAASVPSPPAAQLADDPAEKGPAPRGVASPAPPVERRPRSVTLPPVIETGYRIQVAAANTLEEAQALHARLTAAGHPAYLLHAVVGRNEVFRVRVGPFETIEEAREISSQLKRDGYTGAWIER